MAASERDPLEALGAATEHADEQRASERRERDDRQDG